MKCNYLTSNKHKTLQWCFSGHRFLQNIGEYILVSNTSSVSESHSVNLLGVMIDVKFCLDELIDFAFIWG